MAVPLAIAAAVLAWAPRADAGFQVTLSANGSSVTISDGGAGDNDNTVDNTISIFSQNVGGYNFVFVLTATNTPNVGGEISFVNNSVGAITNVSGGSTPTTVSIYASANGFVSPTAPPPLTASTNGTIQYLSPTPSNQQANVSVMSYYDQSNVLSTTALGSTLMGSDSATITNNATQKNAILSDVQGVAMLASPYTINLLLSADLLQTTSRDDSPTSFTRIDLDGTVELSAVPEPSGLVATLAGLPVLGGYWLRRRNAKRSA